MASSDRGLDRVPAGQVHGGELTGGVHPHPSRLHERDEGRVHGPGQTAGEVGDVVDVEFAQLPVGRHVWLPPSTQVR